MTHLPDQQPDQSASDSIVGSLAAKQTKSDATSQWLIIVGVASAIVGLIMRLVARGQISKARDLAIFTDPGEAVRNAATLANVGLAFLIIGGALVFLGILAVIIRR